MTDKDGLEPLAQNFAVAFVAYRLGISQRSAEKYLPANLSDFWYGLAEYVINIQLDEMNRRNNEGN